LIEKHGFREDPAHPGLPLDVPDGEYPMTIDGKLDHVRVEGGKINCCNFEDEPALTGV
jgi:hypothetical protein